MSKEAPLPASPESFDENAIALSFPAVALLLKFTPEMQMRIVTRLIESITVHERKEASIILAQHVAEAAVAVSKSDRNSIFPEKNGTPLNGAGKKKRRQR